MPATDTFPGNGAPTFLFTDIESSTEKWEQEPTRMAQALACHDQLIRGTVEAHRGRVVKSTGDGVHAVFGYPLDGMRAIIGIQTRLRDPAATAGIPLMVRCGLHCGEAEVRGNDFFGPTLNRAARIMNAAYGGQALVSHSVAELTADRLPATFPCAISAPCGSRASQPPNMSTSSFTHSFATTFRRCARWKQPHTTFRTS